MSNINKPEVKLVGTDGNAFAIIAKVKNALKKAGYPKEHVDKFIEEATSGDYDHLLQICCKYVDVS